MTKNDQSIEEALRAGGTVVVPNRQRAHAISLAYAQGCLARGLSTWPAPDVLPFAAWLGRCVDEDRARALPSLRRLGSDEEWLLWREAAREAGGSEEWLQAATLGEGLRESVRLRREWGLAASSAMLDAEDGYQARAMVAFAAAARTLRAVSAEDWPLLLARALPATVPLLFAGFDDPGDALVARVEALGGRWLAPGGQSQSAERSPPGESAGAPGLFSPVLAEQVDVLADRASELIEAAKACRERLIQQPDARLLVVVPQLAQCRELAARCFERVLHGEAMLREAGLGPMYALEGGLPLIDNPMVQAALGLWRLLAGEPDFDALSALLRSPYLGLADAADCLAVELQLRDSQVTRASLATLIRIASRRAPALVLGLQALQDALAAAPARETAAGWAPWLAGVLEAAGWPGAMPLGSAEQQVRERCEELLGQFAQLGGRPLRMSLAAAVELLGSLAARVSFEPANEDAPVTLTASTADPLVHYDAIHVLGLNAEHWPRPVQPDPFIPVALQRARGIRKSMAAGQLALAVQAMRGWRARTETLVLSCARAEDDAELQPSSLLGLGAPAESRHDALPGAGIAHDPLWLALHAARRHEPMAVIAGTALAAGARLPGGTRALTLQAECPFKALAMLRLGARPLPAPQFGLPAAERGSLMHSVLEIVWNELRSSEGLRACSGEGRAALVDGAIESAITQLRGRMPVRPAELLFEIEARRLRGLVLALLLQEEQRAPFTVEHCERKLGAHLGGVPLELRIDRVDRLADGRFVVLDYKSGRAQRFDPLEERPAQAQLIAYALATSEDDPGHREPAALACVHLRAGEVLWRGASSAAGLLPRLPEGSVQPDEFGQWLAQWRRVLPRLAQSFAAGEAWVSPRVHACERCHLAALCRVDADALAAAEATVEARATASDDVEGADE